MRKIVRARRAVHSSIVAAVAALAVVVTSSPAMAVHQEFSAGRVSRGTADQTYTAPTVNYNLNELGIGCPRSAGATFVPKWKVSNVTATSAYVDTLTITFTPRNSPSRILGAHLTDGTGQTVWTGNWG